MIFKKKLITFKILTEIFFYRNTAVGLKKWVQMGEVSRFCLLSKNFEYDQNYFSLNYKENLPFNNSVILFRNIALKNIFLK